MQKRFTRPWRPSSMPWTAPKKGLEVHGPGYMDLCIEALGYNDHEGRPVYSVAHYGEQNGDLMRDRM